jgi:hypothetical protein
MTRVAALLGLVFVAACGGREDGVGAANVSTSGSNGTTASYGASTSASTLGGSTSQDDVLPNGTVCPNGQLACESDCAGDIACFPAPCPTDLHCVIPASGLRDGGCDEGGTLCQNCDGSPYCAMAGCSLNICPIDAGSMDAGEDAQDDWSDAGEADEGSFTDALQCAGIVSGPGTEACLNAGGVCADFPDTTCCTLVAGFDPVNSGCPHEPFAIRCCLPL